MSEMEIKARKALEVFDYHSKTETGKAFYGFKAQAIMENDPFYEALSEAIHEADVSEESGYRFVHEALEHIANGDERDFGGWADADTDVYTSDLTEWLNESDKHVEYLGEAVREFGETDGFKILQAAQYLAREKVYSQTWDALEQLNLEEDDSEEDNQD